MKALGILKETKSVDKRADSFVESIKRNIQRDVLDTLTNQIEKLEDKKFELQDFSLATDLNAGITQITRDKAEERFKEIIKIDFEISLLQAELKIKQQSFDEYFKEESNEKTE